VSARRRALDVALLYAPTEDDKGARVVRVRRGRLETGEVRPLPEGRALHGQELVRLRPRDEFPTLCDVEVVCPAERSGSQTHGPAQVATDQYRHNWERTFGSVGKRQDLAN
jgi:hypothetical protein